MSWDTFLPGERVKRLTSSRRRGQSVVEFAIVAIIFFLLISGVVDFGRMLNAWVVVSTAGREGVRWASIGASVEQIEERVRNFSSVPGVDPATGISILVTPPPNTLSTGDSVTVRVTTTEFEVVTPLVRPFFCGNDPGPCYVPISSETTMRFEGVFIP